jgi:hypothetical protein
MFKYFVVFVNFRLSIATSCTSLAADLALLTANNMKMATTGCVPAKDATTPTGTETAVSCALGCITTGGAPYSKDVLLVNIWLKENPANTLKVKCDITTGVWKIEWSDNPDVFTEIKNVG